MEKLNIKKTGLALGITGVIFYLACIIIIMLAGHKGSTMFFNALLHGLDVGPVLRTDIPVWEAGLGIVETFVIGGIAGCIIAAVYNFNFTKKNKS